MLRKKKQEMTAAELAATRERLGWSRERMSEELGLLPAEAEALEAGSISVSREVAATLRELGLAHERQRILDESGLPACAEADALAAAVYDAFRGGDPAVAEGVVDALVRHERQCGVCQPRAEYLRVHGPRDPGPRLPLWMRVLGGIGILVDRLPRPLRPPSGPRGEHRRTGIFLGAYLTVAAGLIIGGFAAVEVVTGSTGEESVLQPALALPVLAVAYVAGGYLAGAAWDATRGIRHRLAGYVLRGGATAAAMYGAMGLAMPFLDVEPLSLAEFLVFLAILTVFGAVAGAGKWIWDRWMDDLPEPVTDLREGSASEP